jgi:cellulose synthase/poly-beta-1,6-N-acetylglucosamine synthase-like glycosyltransferase
MILQLLCACVVVPAVAAALYHALLAVIGFATRDTPSACPGSPTHSFAVLIPAYNEEAGISETLRSCAKLDYPSDLFQVFVVADNCTDGTATIAARLGANCLERRDEDHRGKGYALAWAVEHILARGHDAIVVLDADCMIDRHALRTFDAHLSRGRQVLQTKVVGSNPDASMISYASVVGSVLENDLFYAPKSRLGLAVFLRGTGMVFRHDVLELKPWRATSTVEDTEYTLRLLRSDVAVHFVPDVTMRTPAPVALDQMRVQRERWAAGNFRLGVLHSLPLIAEGLIRWNPLLIDAGWTMCILSRPLLLVLSLLGLALATTCWFTIPSSYSGALFATAAAALLVQGLCLVLAIARLGVTFRRLALLPGVPLVAIQLIRALLRSAARRGSAAWVRTPRSTLRGQSL